MDDRCDVNLEVVSSVVLKADDEEARMSARNEVL